MSRFDRDDVFRSAIYRQLAVDCLNASSRVAGEFTELLFRVDEDSFQSDRSDQAVIELRHLGSGDSMGFAVEPGTPSACIQAGLRRAAKRFEEAVDRANPPGDAPIPA